VVVESVNANWYVVVVTTDRNQNTTPDSNIHGSAGSGIPHQAEGIGLFDTGDAATGHTHFRPLDFQHELVPVSGQSHLTHHRDLAPYLVNIVFCLCNVFEEQGLHDPFPRSHSVQTLSSAYQPDIPTASLEAFSRREDELSSVQFASALSLPRVVVCRPACC
jgi:hypothetical protein